MATMKQSTKGPKTKSKSAPKRVSQKASLTGFKAGWIQGHRDAYILSTPATLFASSVGMSGNAQGLQLMTQRYNQLVRMHVTRDRETFLAEIREIEESLFKVASSMKLPLPGTN